MKAQIANVSSHVYYNITIRNDLPEDNNLGVPAVFEETRVEPLLYNPSEYHLSIIRFEVPANLIPIYIMDIQPYRESTGVVTAPIGPAGRVVLNMVGGPHENLEPSDLIDVTGSTTVPSIDGQYEVKQLLSATSFSIDVPFPITTAGTAAFARVQDPNQTTWSITLEHNGDIIQKYVRWRSQAAFPPAPPPVTAENPVWPRGFYYFGYSYEHAVALINETFEAAFDDLTAAPGAAKPPYVEYDQPGRLAYVLQKDFYSETVAAATRIDIYGNIPYLEKFTGFNYFNTETTFGRFARLVVSDIPQNLFTPNNDPTPPLAYLRIPQEYNAIFRWNVFKDLVFLSSSIPIDYEYVRSDSEGLVRFQPILTDYQPIFTDAGESRSILQYFPQGPYRLIDLNGTTPLRSIDLEIRWIDDKGNSYPVYITKDSIASVKMLFRRRRLTVITD